MQRFSNVKIVDCDGFDVIKYCTRTMDKTQPWMIVRHVHGKKEGNHFHVCGVKNLVNGKPIDHIVPHPLYEYGKKPIQCKKQLYDEGCFNYCIKPKEWATGNCVIDSSFSEERLQELAEESRLYFEGKKSTVPELLASITPHDWEQAEDYHNRLKDAVLEHMIKQDITMSPVFKQCTITRVTRHKRFHPYCRKFL